MKKFQSPDGDFVYSDMASTGDWKYLGFVFQSPDGDFVYSDGEIGDMANALLVGFNPLTGISSILTQTVSHDSLLAMASFNPLTGISSILT